MPRAKRTCTHRTLSSDGEEMSCPQIATNGNRCDDHAVEVERVRGSRQQRGYDRNFDRTRARWVPIVATGRVRCWRCGEVIVAGTRWNLGHDDVGRVRGPEHESSCNLRAAGLKSKGLPWTPGVGRNRS